MSDSRLEEFSLAPSIFLPFPSFPNLRSQNGQIGQEIDTPVIKLQKIISNLDAQQSLVRANMITFVRRRAKRLKSFASNQLDSLNEYENDYGVGIEIQVRDEETEEKQEGYEELLERYEKELKAKEKEIEIEELFAVTKTRAKRGCKSEDFEWDFNAPITKMNGDWKGKQILHPITTTGISPIPLNGGLPGTAISPSPVYSISSMTFNNPQNLPTTATSPPPTPLSATTTTTNTDDIQMPDAPPAHPPPTSSQKQTSPDQILISLSTNLRILVDRAAFEIGQYDIHAAKASDVYKYALERRKVREESVASRASSSLSMGSNMFSYGSVGAIGMGMGPPSSFNASAGSIGPGGMGGGVTGGGIGAAMVKDESRKPTGGNGKMAGVNGNQDGVRRTSTGMPICGVPGQARVMESIEDLARRGSR